MQKYLLTLGLAATLTFPISVAADPIEELVTLGKECGHSLDYGEDHARLLECFYRLETHDWNKLIGVEYDGNVLDEKVVNIWKMDAISGLVSEHLVAISYLQDQFCLSYIDDMELGKTDILSAETHTLLANECGIK